MKAKGYARIFNLNPSLEALQDILVYFFEEGVELIEARNARTEAAQFAVFDEQNQKWKAFSRLVTGVKEDGFELTVKHEAPEIYDSWMKYKNRRRVR